MSDTYKLLKAFIEAQGYEVEEERVIIRSPLSSTEDTVITRYKAIKGSEQNERSINAIKAEGIREAIEYYEENHGMMGKLLEEVVYTSKLLNAYANKLEKGE